MKEIIITVESVIPQAYAPWRKFIYNLFKTWQLILTEFSMVVYENIYLAA